MQEKYFITPEGYKKLESELGFLKTKELPSITRAIEEARAHGDLSENAEYHAAKERQGFIVAKITDLESRFARAELLDITKLSGTQVIFGVTATVEDEDNGKIFAYKITSDYEANLEQGSISINSPMAKAMLGRTKGDEIEVNTPTGIRYYRIVNVEYK